MTELVIRDGGELVCRVCGLGQSKPIWGAAGDEPTFETCACCGCTFGHEDVTPSAVRVARDKWTSDGAKWLGPEKRPQGWNLEEQLAKIPRFYFRVLPGLPATGPLAISFDESGTTPHAEGFVIKLIRADGESWIGNFRPGHFGKFGVFILPGEHHHALVLAKGSAYVIDPDARKLVRGFGGGITDLLYLPARDAMIFSDGMGLERLDSERVIWTTRRISWDGISNLSIADGRISGDGWDAIHECSKSFEVNLETGEAIGGAYPAGLWRS